MKQMRFADAEYAGKRKKTRRELRPGKRRALPRNAIGKVAHEFEPLKASVRAKFEHSIHIVKNLFGLRKVRYLGLFKNTVQLYMLVGMADLLIGKRRLLGLHARGACRECGFAR